MIACIQIGPLLAEGSFVHMGERFRSGGTALNLFDIASLVAILLVATILIWLLSRHLNRRDSRGYNNSRALFHELCQAHNLPWSSRRLLIRLAKSQELANPARLFVEPQRFNPSNPATSCARQSAINALAEQLFCNETEGREE